jgi:hypothetical protein
VPVHQYRVENGYAQPTIVWQMPAGFATTGSYKVVVKRIQKKLRSEATVNRLTLKISRINPGDWAKVESGWLAQPLQDRVVRFGSRGRIHQFLWPRSRAVSIREKGTER